MIPNTNRTGREQDDQRGREVREDRVLAPLLHVAEGPVRGREPEDDEVDDERLEGELHDRVREEAADRVTDRVEDLVHARGCGLHRAWRARGRAASSSLTGTPGWTGARSRRPDARSGDARGCRVRPVASAPASRSGVAARRRRGVDSSVQAARADAGADAREDEPAEPDRDPDRDRRQHAGGVVRVRHDVADAGPAGGRGEPRGTVSSVSTTTPKTAVAMTRTGRRTRSTQPSSHATRTGRRPMTRRRTPERRGGVAERPRRPAPRRPPTARRPGPRSAERRREVVRAARARGRRRRRAAARRRCTRRRPAAARAPGRWRRARVPGAPSRSGGSSRPSSAAASSCEPDQVALGPGARPQAADEQPSAGEHAAADEQRPSRATASRPRAC